MLVSHACLVSTVILSLFVRVPVAKEKETTT